LSLRVDYECEVGQLQATELGERWMYGKATRPMKEEEGGKRQQRRKKQWGREKGKNDVARYRGGREG
jgi:hypothetical protein